MSEQEERLRSQMEMAFAVGRRVFGEGGVAGQLTEESFDFHSDRGLDEDLVDVWTAAAEHARFARAISPGESVPAEHRDTWTGSLPLNRKERFYTGTVLPCLITSDGFVHLDRFLKLCGIHDVEFDGNRQQIPDVTFFTEYGFAESVFTQADRERWTGDLGKDTPDIVIAGGDWLVAVEAKVYDIPDSAKLAKQVEGQAVLVRRWAAELGFSPERVRHVLLLAEQHAQTIEVPSADAVVTWQDVLEAYRVVGPAYWVNMLQVALNDYPNLVSNGLAFGTNSTERMTGVEISERHADGTLAVDAVGRVGGFNGPKFRSDIDSGSWRKFSYEVRSGGPANPNWFTVEEFIAAVSG